MTIRRATARHARVTGMAGLARKAHAANLLTDDQRGPW